MAAEQTGDLPASVDDAVAAEGETRFQGNLLYIATSVDIGVVESTGDAGHRWLMILLQGLDACQTGHDQLGSPPNPM